MGRAIFYCVQCSKRVSDADLDAGKAFRVGERILCGVCTPANVKTQTSSKRIPAAPRKSSGTSVAMKSVTAPIATPPPAAAGPADRKKQLMLIGGGAALLVLLGVAGFLAFRSRPAPAKPPEDAAAPAAKVDPAVAKPADTKEASAKADLDKARAFAKSRPEDLAGQLREYTDVVWKWEGSDAAREASREAATVKAAIMEKVAVWMADLEGQVQELLAAKQYFAAVRRIEELKPAHDLPEWRLAAEKRASEIYQLGKKASEEGGGQKPVEEKAAVVPATPAKPPDKPASEEAKGYHVKWEAAVARATARDYAGAIADLEKTALQDPDVKRELDEDLALLRKAAALFKESMDYLRKRPRGSGLSLLHRDGRGEIKRSGGTILHLDAERVEIRGAKGSTLIEWADVAAATFGEIAQRGKFDPSACAALCLLEGEMEAAQAYRPEIAQKWWTYAGSARSKIPAPEPSEKNARDLYASAERGWRSMDTRAAAIETYKTLSKDCASTSLVRAYAERISRRSEAGKEYYFAPADFRVDGTIRLAKSGKLESTKDSDLPETLLNLAEIEFAQLPGLTYRCWLQVGACCEETFAFYYQGTELMDTDPKTRKKISCDTETTFAVPVKHSIRNLKKSHDDHKPKGAKTHPKTAARWEWIEIVLPKYAAPGAKKLKFVTNQAGFSIGGAVISSTRKAAPPEAEVKDLEKARALDEPPALPIDPDLVAWWTFDEAAGDLAADQTGRNHGAKLVGGAKAGEGKLGSGLAVGGGSAGAEAADAEDLRITGDLTMAIWVKKTEEVGDWVCIFGKGTSPQRNYGLWLEPTSKKYMYQQYGGSDVNVYGAKLVETGQWIHLAVTIQQDLVKVYYNGALDGQGARPGKPPVNNGPLGLGFALHHTGLKGAIDDARLYSRALSNDEIRSLYEMGK